MDTTIQGLPMTEQKMEKIVREILAIDVGDGISFEFLAIFFTAPFICSALFIATLPCIFPLLLLFEIFFHISLIFVRLSPRS